MLPVGLALGFTEEEFGKMTPTRLKPYMKAFDIKKDLQDEQMWYMGAYVYNATVTAIDNVLNGRKSRAKYIEKPLRQQTQKGDYSGLSEEEKIAKTKLLFHQLEAARINYNLNKKDKESVGAE